MKKVILKTPAGILVVSLKEKEQKQEPVIVPVARIAKENIKIFGATLLSAEEVQKYLTEEDIQYRNSWWLRSAKNEKKVYTVNNIAHIDTLDLTTKGCYGGPQLSCVRPALKIDVGTSWKIGDIFRFGGKEFKIIAHDIAWMHNSDIGWGPFRDELSGPNLTDYKASDVKKHIDTWFKEAIK